jgi:hypothetical protein
MTGSGRPAARHAALKRTDAGSDRSKPKDKSSRVRSLRSMKGNGKTAADLALPLPMQDANHADNAIKGPALPPVPQSQHPAWRAFGTARRLRAGVPPQVLRGSLDRVRGACLSDVRCRRPTGGTSTNIRRRIWRSMMSFAAAFGAVPPTCETRARRVWRRRWTLMRVTDPPSSVKSRAACRPKREPP